MVQITRELWRHAASGQGLSLVISPNGEYIYAGTEDGQVFCLAHDGSLRWQHPVQGEAFKLAVAADGSRVAVGTINGSTITVLDGEGRVAWTYTADGQTAGGVAVSADGSRICGLSDDGYVRVFDGEGRKLWEYNTNADRLYGLSMTSDGAYVGLGADHDFILLDADGNKLWSYSTGNNAWCGMRVSPGGEFIAAGSNDQHVYFFTRDGELLWRHRIDGNVNNIAITPDAEHLAVGSTDDHVYLLDRSGRRLWRHKTGDSVYGITISMDGQFVFAGSYDSHLYLFDSAGELLLDFRGDDKFYTTAMTPSGRYFAGFGFDHRLYFFENMLAGQSEGERQAAGNLLAARSLNRVRRAYIDQPVYGLCIWFEEFSHYIRHSKVEICEALLNEVRSQPYPYTAGEHQAIDSHEGALLMRRGALEQASGQYESAEGYYRRAAQIQKRAGCMAGEGQARLALDLLASERATGERDPMLDELLNGELHVLSASEGLLIGRLAGADAVQVRELLDVAKRLRLVRPILQSLKSDNERIRMLAAATLNRFTEIGDVPALVAAMRDPNAFIRWQVTSALSRQAVPPPVINSLGSLLRSEADPEVRRALVHVFANQGDRQHTPLLLEALNDSDADVRYTTCNALAKFGDRRAMAKLQQVTDGDGLFEYNVREAAQAATSAINARYPLPSVKKRIAARVQPTVQSATLFWTGETVVLFFTIPNPPATTRLLLRCGLNREAPEIELRGTYEEFQALTAVQLADIILPERLLSYLEIEPLAFVLKPPEGDWTPGLYSASLLIYDEVAEVNEVVSRQDFRIVSTPILKDTSLYLTPKAPERELTEIVEYASDIYLSAKLSLAPYGTVIHAELWREETLVERQQIVNQEESDHTLTFHWHAERWPLGDYQIRLRIQEALGEPIRFAIRPYVYTDWKELPTDQPQPWAYLVRHLIRLGELERLRATVLDLHYVAQRSILCGAEEAEADLYAVAGALPADRQIGLLRRSFARISHIIRPGLSNNEAVLTIHAWLREVPELVALVAALEPNLPLPRLAAWHDLPGIHPAVVRTLTGHTDSVWSCTFTPDSRSLISTSDDMNVKVWDMQTGAESLVLRGKDERQLSSAITPDGRYILTGGWPTLQLWEVATGKRLRMMGGHSNLVFSCKISPDGTWAISGGGDGTIRVWSLPEGSEKLRVKHSGEVLDCLISPDGSWFASAGNDNAIKLWDTATGEQRKLLEGHTASVTGLTVSGDGKHLVSCSADGTIKLWHLDETSAPITLTGHEGTVWRVLFTPDERYIISVGFDHTLRLWDIERETEHFAVRGHVSAVRGLAISPDGRLIATASEDKDIKVWDLNLLLAKTAAHERYIPMWFGTISTDGTLAITDSYHDVKVWDTATGRMQKTLKKHSDEVLGSDISPDNNWAVTCSRDKAVVRWNLATGESHVLTGHTDAVWRCAVSPDGQWIVSGSADRTLRFWNAATGEPGRILTGHTGQINGCTFSPDGRLIVSTSSDDTVRVWDAETGECLWVLTGHNASVLCCTVSPDSRYAITGGYDHHIKVWDLTTGQEEATLTGHTHNVQGVAVSPDGRLLLSGASKGGLRVWDFASRECLTSMYIDRSVTNCAWLPDGERIMVSSGSGLYFMRYVQAPR